ncbi:MAG: sodium:solute symporter [Pirellulales bacterium]|nr:sodium:solute symporter [Pirellulales bacterium]
MNDPQMTGGVGTLAALGVVILASIWLGAMAQRAVERGSFLSGYFLGNRGLGAWAMALTATVQSGGTFMGFPSFVYAHGWIVALWIAGYMMVPITGFAVIGKRMAQLSRRSGALTVPDLLRERFASPIVGLAASLLIMLFLSFVMIAQFKAGALVMKLSWPGTGAMALNEAEGQIDLPYYIGLAVFSLTVIGYTMFGGFLASVWTDLFQSVLMGIGVVILLVLVVPAAGGLEHATRVAVEHTGPEYACGPGYDPHPQAGVSRQFLTPGLAISMFCLWVFSGVGAPAGIVRVMATRDTQTLRRSVFLLSLYNLLIYLPLIAICICARSVMPDLAKSDEVIPRMALWATRDLPAGSFVAGLILAAPFGAVMATVSSYLVVISSGLVRDIYQRFVHHEANEETIRRLTYATMIVVGTIAIVANIRPVEYLQAIVVFSGGGMGASFLVAALMAAYWRRATAAGVLAAMLAGAGSVIALTAMGWFRPDPLIGAVTKFRPYFWCGFDPVVWGLLFSLAAGVVVSMLTRPPAPAHVARFFDRLDAPPSPAASDL